MKRDSAMSEALARREVGDAIESVLVRGDLTQLSATDRVTYYNAVCSSVGLNPLTKPFEYIQLNGKLTLYARKDATDQLRSLHGVAIVILSREILDDVYVVTARATLPNGRTDESVGAVTIGGLKGDNKANALMKAESKAKRRVTLSICGLGMLDETELETIHNKQQPYQATQAQRSAKQEYLDAIKTELVRMCGDDRGKKAALLEELFATRVWKDVQALDEQALERGLDALREKQLDPSAMELPGWAQ